MCQLLRKAGAAAKMLWASPGASRPVLEQHELEGQRIRIGGGCRPAPAAALALDVLVDNTTGARGLVAVA